jgi:hypothetical protein
MVARFGVSICVAGVCYFRLSVRKSRELLGYNERIGVIQPPVCEKVTQEQGTEEGIIALDPGDGTFSSL